MFQLPARVLVPKACPKQPGFNCFSFNWRYSEASHSQRQARGTQVKTRFTQKARNLTFLFSPDRAGLEI